VIARVLTARWITPDQVLEYDDPTAAGNDVAQQLGLGDESEDRPRGSIAARLVGKLPPSVWWAASSKNASTAPDGR
jgi:hypothetical protein